MALPAGTFTEAMKRYDMESILRAGRFATRKAYGLALRVPVADASIVDLVCQLDKDVSRDDVNAAMKEAAEGKLKGILEYCEDPIASSDIIGNPHSSVFDSLATVVMSKRMVKVLSWYDNEWAYSVRMVDLMAKAAKL